MNKILLTALLLSGCFTPPSNLDDPAEATGEAAQSAPVTATPSIVAAPAELTLTVHPLECMSCVSNTECSDSPCGIFCKRGAGFSGVCGVLNP